MLSATTAKVQYTLTSAAPALAIPFYFLENSHIVVIRTRATTEETLASGYSISGVGNPSGGTVTLDGTATDGGDRITIKRVVPLNQLTSYAPNDRFPASSHERALDRLTMIAQQISELAGRALVYGSGEVIGSGNMLPDVPTRERKILGFKTDGTLDLTVSLEDIRTLIVANPVAALTDVTDYGSVGDPVTDVADYGSIA
jgi:hypothetical protein